MPVAASIAFGLACSSLLVLLVLPSPHSVRLCKSPERLANVTYFFAVETR